MDEALVLEVLAGMAHAAPDVADRASSNVQHLWKVLAALGGLVSELPLGGAPLAAALDAYLDLVRHLAAGLGAQQATDAFAELGLPVLLGCFHCCPAKRPCVLQLLVACGGTSADALTLLARFKTQKE